jgi:ankyrin repeat protein
MHIACIRGFTPIVRLLAGAGCNVNAKDSDENSPLHHASEYGHFETIIYLIKEAGADGLVKNKFGYTPSDIA